MALLESLWLVVELPAWSANLGKRLVRTPKMTLNDTGLRYLQSAVGERFRWGILLHTGEKASSPAKNLHALPFSVLWRK